MTYACLAQETGIQPRVKLQLKAVAFMYVRPFLSDIVLSNLRIHQFIQVRTLPRVCNHVQSSAPVDALARTTRHLT